MWIRIIRYATYKQNPNAAQLIADGANRWIAKILGVLSVSVFTVVPSGRAVSGGEFDVIMVVSFLSKEACDAYNKHPQHMMFVRFVLRGWQLKDSVYGNQKAREDEFIGHILDGRQRMEWKRDPAVPAHEVVWSGEAVDEGKVIAPRED